mgnify:CR=1 FL=1
MAASAALLLHYRASLNFMLDDWAFVIGREDGKISDFLDPHNEHISVIPVAIYKLFLAVFGMGSPWPLQILSVALFMLAVGVLFFYLKPLAGDPLSLIGCAVILFLGSAWEDLLWIFQLGFSISLASGLGALIMLRRQDVKGDRLACLLLAVCILSTSLGVPFVIGATVDLLLRRDGFRMFTSRIWIVAVPTAIYVAWWLGWGHTAQSGLSADNVAGAPKYVFEAFRLNVGILTGTFKVEGSMGIGLMRLITVALVAATGIWLFRRRRLPRPLLVAVAIGLAFWGLAALNQIPGREFGASRYLLPGAVFVLMMLAGALDGYRVKSRYVVMVAAIAVIAIVSNIQVMSSGYEILKPLSDKGIAGLTALDIAGEQGRPDGLLGMNEDDSAVVVSADYFDAEEKYGSAAWSPDEIADSPEEARVHMDEVLISFLPVTSTGVDPVSPGTRCTTVKAGSGSGVESVKVTGRNFTASPKSDVFILLSRFADLPTTGAAFASGDSTIRVDIPPDRAGGEWRVGFAGSGSVTVCQQEHGS